MAGKNHHRYKIRKRINKIKHESKPLFDTPPWLIESWSQLNGLQNDKYIIEVDEYMCNGWVKPKFDVSEEESWVHNMYLSTHTFYGSNYFNTTWMLRSRFGFNVQLANWDGQTLYCR